MAKQAAKRKQGSKKAEAMVQVDAYLIPEAQAAMYQTLRQAVADEAQAFWQERYHRVEWVQDPDEGQGLAVYNEAEERLFCFYLNPQNISQSQIARDKDQLAKYLLRFEEEQGILED